MYNLGTIVNNGKYEDVITSNDPDRGKFDYHKGIQLSWKDDVTQNNIEPGGLYNGMDKNGNKYVASSGDVVYAPIGSEYSVELTDFQSENSHTVGINFFLQDECGDQIILSDTVRVFKAASADLIYSLFHRSLDTAVGKSNLSNRIILLEIISALTKITLPYTPDFVLDSMQRICDNIGSAQSVAELAKRYNYSEVYFRRQFKKYVGVSPVEYRKQLQLDRAKDYLEYGEISIQEISDALGFSDVSYFIKEFKSAFHLSPLQYRKQINGRI
jgi:AraC-like DNA-binding protein